MGGKMSFLCDSGYSVLLHYSGYCVGNKGVFAREFAKFSDKAKKSPEPRKNPLKMGFGI